MVSIGYRVYQHLNATVLDCGASTGDYRAATRFFFQDAANWGAPVASGNGATVTTITFPAQAGVISGDTDRQRFGNWLEYS